MKHFSENCVFCEIIQSKKMVSILAETDQVLAFNDIDPQAPLHGLIIPKIHITSIADWNASHGSLLVDMTTVANEIAQKKGYHASGYRLVINCGQDGGQSVEHLHMHLMAGRKLQWPPG